MYSLDPVKLEELRTSLACKDDFCSLRKTYNIKLNISPKSSLFWDKKIINTYFTPQDPITKDRIKTILRMVPKYQKLKVLDIGAGYGYIEEGFRCQQNIDLYAIDISWEAISRLQKKYKGHFTVASVLKLPYDGFEIFDIVLMPEVLEHLQPQDCLKALSQVYKVIKKNGFLILSIPINEKIKNLYDLINNPSGHLRIYSEQLILKELQMCGFNCIKIVRLYAFKNLYFVKKIIVNFFPWLKKPNNIILVARKK